MKQIIVWIACLSVSVFFLWGALWINLPSGNYFFAVYDLILATITGFMLPNMINEVI